MVFVAGAASLRTPVSVTITGSGTTGDCYTLINGTIYAAAASGIEVRTGDTIEFCVRGSSNVERDGEVVIDGTQVLKVSGDHPETCAWVVPSSVRTIEITMKRNQYFWYGTITVTTS